MPFTVHVPLPVAFESKSAVAGDFISGTAHVLTAHPEWISTDGIHPNVEGYSRLANAVVVQLRMAERRALGKADAAVL